MELGGDPNIHSRMHHLSPGKMLGPLVFCNRGGEEVHTQILRGKTWASCEISSSVGSNTRLAVSKNSARLAYPRLSGERAWGNEPGQAELAVTPLAGHESIQGITRED